MFNIKTNPINHVYGQEIRMQISTEDTRETRAALVSASSASGVSWGAILAGAAGAAGLSLILVILGAGLGLSSISPWGQEGASGTTISVSAIGWITLMSLLASGMGGYLAGRLRTKWVGIHTDEVFFRDTAHGFLAWAIATLATAALLSSVIAAVIGGGVKAGASMISGAASTASVAAAAGAQSEGQPAGGQDPLDYFVDRLFRSDSAQAPVSPSPEPGITQTSGPAEPADGSANREVVRIFANALAFEDTLPTDDLRYVSQLVAQRTDLSQQEAEQRVSETYMRITTQMNEMKTSAQEMADKARKASAYTSLWFFISLLIGAFVASVSAIFGGRQRDR